VVAGHFPVVSLLLLLAVLAAVAYTAFALVRIRVFAGRRERPAAGPPVTVLKPLRGAEPGLYENLRSFCEQDYPVFQVVFGVRDASDPAIPVVERVMRDLPERDLALVVSDRVIGANLKISNLANMYGSAKHDRLVIADSDMRVGRDYLATVLAPLADPAVGVVTCLYRGRAAGGPWSVLGAMFINEWFLPSVLVARALAPGRFCFGATMAVRREALEAIGGFAALAPYLADDYVLGALMNARGLRVALSSYLVDDIVWEPDLAALFRHELRWARTMRTAQPLGYAMSFLTYSLVLSVVYLLVSSLHALAGVVVGAALVSRVAVHYAVRASLGVTEPARPWLVPVREALCFGVWAASFWGRTVQWGGRKFSVSSDGRMWANGGHHSC
jgi:ceramide glucosyltransferase